MFRVFPLSGFCIAGEMLSTVAGKSLESVWTGICDATSYHPTLCTVSDDSSGRGGGVDQPKLIPRIFDEPIRAPSRAELFVLLELGHGPGHIYGITHRITERTGGAIKFTYPGVQGALRKMEEMGYIEVYEIVRVFKGRPERINYELTPSGRTYLRNVREVLAAMLI